MKLSLRVFALLPLFMLCACDYFVPSMTINYKVTVEIETPEGVKSGYAVQQISNSTPLFRLPDVGNPASIKGEAVVVDLGQRGKVFALLPDQSWQNGLYQAFPIKGASTKEGIQYYRSLKIGSKAEWKNYRPKMILYEDGKGPKTSQILYWQQTKNTINNFDKIFGQGVHLKSVTVEITNQPITWGDIDKHMPQFDGGHYSVRQIHFKKGEQE